MSNRVPYGVVEGLEAVADEIIFGSIKDVTSREAKSDILTPWKEKHRRTHEVLTRSGAPVDGAVRKGMFNRAYNRQQPHLNSYDGPTRPIRMNEQFDPDLTASPNKLSPEFVQIFGVERDD
jgi:hypothetical protein